MQMITLSIIYIAVSTHVRNKTSLRNKTMLRTYLRCVRTFKKSKCRMYDTNVYNVCTYYGYIFD